MIKSQREASTSQCGNESLWHTDTRPCHEPEVLYFCITGAKEHSLVTFSVTCFLLPCSLQYYYPNVARRDGHRKICLLLRVGFIGLVGGRRGRLVDIERQGKEMRNRGKMDNEQKLSGRWAEVKSLCVCVCFVLFFLFIYFWLVNVTHSDLRVMGGKWL